MPAETPDALAEAAKRLKEDRALRETLTRNSLEAAPLYSRKRQAREMLEVLELAAAGRGAEAGERVKGVA